MPRSITRLLAILGGVVLLISGGAVAAVATGVVQPVGIQDVTHEWGEVTAQTTEVQTTVVLRNTGPFGVVVNQVDIQYSGTLNGITFFRGERTDVAVRGGRNRLHFSTKAPTSKIPVWWQTHINNGETSTMKTRSKVVVSTPLGAVPLSGPRQQHQIETNMLGTFNTTQDQEVAVRNRTLLVIKERQASWGHATQQQTPIDAQIRVHNSTPIPILFSKVAYAIKLNGKKVGRGQTEKRIQIGPRSTETVKINAIINNDKLDEWWVSHHKRGQQTTLTIQIYAVVEFQGQQERILIGSASTTMEIELLPSGD